MSDWKIELRPRSGTTLLGEVLMAQSIWKRLSKPARAAVEQLANGVQPTVHPNTMHALSRRGFVTWDQTYSLTDAGRRVAKWNT